MASYGEGGERVETADKYGGTMFITQVRCLHATNKAAKNECPSGRLCTKWQPAYRTIMRSEAGNAWLTFGL
eukprot:658999-Rhodomonas_salina.1